MELQMMIAQQQQNALTQAQINNVNADTKGKQIDNANKDKGGIDYQLTEGNLRKPKEKSD